MHTVANLLTQGNGKLGDHIYGWSIPAVETCPGRSPLCERHCYAKTGYFAFPSNRERLHQNLTASTERGFVRRMVREIGRRWCQVVRIHVAGDFYSAEYIARWTAIAQACPDTTFYAYTRSWRVAEMVPALETLAQQGNVRLWYSADDDTGNPPEVPAGVRVAYLMQDAGHVENVDLVFRTYRLRQQPRKRIGLALVCPVENGSHKHTDCGQCGHCWK